MQHNTLENYLKTIFTLKMAYNYSKDEVESMIPWERDVFIDLIEDKVNKDTAAQHVGYQPDF